MRKIIFISFAILALAVSAVATSAASAAGSKPLTIAMKDPGCHWFSVGGKYVKTVVRSGPVTLLNQDEAAVIVKGPGGTKIEKVGAKLTLRAKGTYHLTMVKQASDDNHLTLKIT